MAKAAVSASLANWVLATTMTPDVSLSSRCTIPGRRSAPMPVKPGAAMREQRVHQRAVEIAGGRVDDQAGRLVEHDQVRIFV